MRVLLVAATAAEIAPVVAALTFLSDAGPRLKRYARAKHEVEVLTTGVGMVATAAWCARVMNGGRYSLVLNAGVCGAFDPGLPPGTVVQVVADRLSELGAEDGDAFLSIQDLGLLGPHEYPFTGGQLVNADPPENAAIARLPQVSGITVNTAHGNDRTIAEVAARFAPAVESMEGAAFMYAAIISKLPFAQLRAVSNVVERRNRDAWKLDGAIQALGTVVRDVLDQA